MISNDPQGFECECGMRYRYGPWVWENWFQRFLHTCRECNTQHVICEGIPKRLHPKLNS